MIDGNPATIIVLSAIAAGALFFIVHVGVLCALQITRRLTRPEWAKTGAQVEPRATPVALFLSASFLTLASVAMTRPEFGTISIGSILVLAVLLFGAAVSLLNNYLTWDETGIVVRRPLMSDRVLSWQHVDHVDFQNLYIFKQITPFPSRDRAIIVTSWDAGFSAFQSAAKEHLRFRYRDKTLFR